jgi:type IV secretion system protein TrbE
VDSLTLSPWQAFDLSALKDYPELMRAWLFYVVHRTDQRIKSTPGLKLCLMDEAWHFLLDPMLRAYVQRALKTWRKHNAVMVLATHSLSDFAGDKDRDDLVHAVINSCPIKYFLASSSEIRHEYAGMFGLNEQEQELLASLQAKREVLMKLPHLTKALRLDLDSKTYWICSNTPADNARYNEAVREFGFEAALDYLTSTER